MKYICRNYRYNHDPVYLFFLHQAQPLEISFLSDPSQDPQRLFEDNYEILTLDSQEEITNFRNILSYIHIHIHRQEILPEYLQIYACYLQFIHNAPDPSALLTLLDTLSVSWTIYHLLLYTMLKYLYQVEFDLDPKMIRFLFAFERLYAMPVSTQPFFSHDKTHLSSLTDFLNQQAEHFTDLAILHSIIKKDPQPKSIAVSLFPQKVRLLEQISMDKYRFLIKN